MDAGDAWHCLANSWTGVRNRQLQDKENKTEDGSSSASGPLLEFHRKLQEIKKQQAEGGQ